MNYYVVEMLLRKYIIFSLIFALTETWRAVIMPLRALGVLRNFGKFGIANTKKTVKEKGKKAALKLTPQPSGKENKPQVCNLTVFGTYFHLNCRVKYLKREEIM